MEQRIIKFKAKRLNDGIWIEGDLVHIGNRVCIGGDHIKGGINDVDPSTVCQFTGLKDKNDKNIWEHDLMIGKPIGSGILEVRYNRGCFKLMEVDGTTEYFELSHIPLNENGNLIEFIVECSKFDKNEEATGKEDNKQL